MSEPCSDCGATEAADCAFADCVQYWQTALSAIDLFSGIGGFALGLERAGGFETVAFCENNPDRRNDLARLFPGVPIHDDVTTFSGSDADVICGGFPCQDISVARGAGALGLAGERSGLWFEYARIIEEVRPLWVIIENSPRLRSLGLETILGFFDAVGYDAFWDGIPASAVGAYHERDRLFIVAHPNGIGCGSGRAGRSAHGHSRQRKPVWQVQTNPDAAMLGRDDERSTDAGSGCQERGAQEPVGRLRSDNASDSNSARLAFWKSFRGHLGAQLSAIKRDRDSGRTQGAAQSGMAGIAHDVPPTLDGPGCRGAERATWKSRVQACGNSVIPDIPEAIGRAINLVTAECAL